MQRMISRRGTFSVVLSAWCFQSDAFRMMLPVRCLDELTGASFLLVIDLVLVQALLDLLEELLGQLLLDHQ